MSNLDLNKMLQEEYNKRIKTYGENRILGTFLIGIANYGYAESEEEVKFVTIYLPNFDNAQMPLLLSLSDHSIIEPF